jgi:hypothetical protein
MRKWMIISLMIGAVSVPFLLSRSKPPVVPAAAAPASSRRDVPHLGERGGWQSVAAGKQPAIFDRLHQAPDEESYRHAKRELYFELLDQIRNHPEVIAALEAMLASEDPSKPATQLAVGALAGSGSPEAQSAMVRLLDRRKGDQTFLDLLVPTMGFAKKPTRELDGALARFASGGESREARSLAHLAIGTSAGRQQRNDPERARRVVEDYQHRLASARPDDLGTYLSVLGNVGTAEAGQVVSRYLDDENPAVRSQALEALRRVPTREAHAQLKRASQEDPDEKVRASAAWALSYQRQ